MIEDEIETVGPRRVPKIPEVIPYERRCQICRDKRRLGYVDVQLTKGLSAMFISKTLTETMNMPTTSHVVNAHRKHFSEVLPVTAKKKEDLAILVVDKTVEAINDGRLEPTISHGLAAQQILDRRADKTQDRDVVLAMARVLSGAAGGDVYLGPPPDLIVDGKFEEITPK